MAKSLFSLGKNNVKIALYYQITTDEQGYDQLTILEEKKAKEMMEEENSNVEVLNTEWKRINWKENNEILSSSKDRSNTEFINIDVFKLRDTRIKKALKKWDLTDDEGKPVPATPDNLDMLPNEIVSALIEKYDNAVSNIKADAEKK